MPTRWISIVVIIIILCGAAYVYSASTSSSQPIKVDALIIAPDKYNDTFNKSATDAKAFYDSFRMALELSKNGEYATAIRALNECLPNAAFKGEKAMVYEALADIHRDMGNLEMELQNVKLHAENTRNNKVKEEAMARASEIRRLIAERNK